MLMYILRPKYTKEMTTYFHDLMNCFMIAQEETLEIKSFER